MLTLPRLALATSLLASLALTIALAGSVVAGGKPLTATLLPANEVAGGDPNPAASGSFAMTANYGHKTICYWLSWENLSAPAAAAHIHIAPAGVAGPVVVPLSVTATTTGSTSACIEDVNADTLKGIIENPSGYYVNVHTSVNPAGAIRGQLAEPEG
jgi:hypothetical protein